MSEQPELFLILHKVRGESAWDVAHEVVIGDEVGWIIPTSGHRAYPTKVWAMSNLELPMCSKDYKQDQSFESWPDHYSANASPKTSIRELIRNLINKPPSAFKKRVW